MSPFQKLLEIKKVFKKILPKIPKKLPKSTQKMTHKKLKKLLTQEAKYITYAQTLTQITQAHTDIKRQIKRLRDFTYILWSPSSFFFSCFSSFFISLPVKIGTYHFFLQTEGRHQMRRNQPKRENNHTNKTDIKSAKIKKIQESR